MITQRVSPNYIFYSTGVLNYGDYFNIKIRKSTYNLALIVLNFFLSLPGILIFTIPTSIAIITFKNKVTNKYILIFLKYWLIVSTLIAILFLPLVLNIFFGVVGFVAGLFIYFISSISKNNLVKKDYANLVKEAQKKIERTLEQEKDFNSQRIKIEALLTIKKSFESISSKKPSLMNLVVTLFLMTKLNSKANLSVIEKENNQALKLISFN